MLRLTYTGNALPASFIVDPAAEFQAGSAAMLTVIGNQVMATVSNGEGFLGVIDDINIKAFTANSWNEVVIVPAIGVPGRDGVLVTPVDIMAELRNAYVAPNSFISTVDVALNPRNGVITFPAGTPLNFDLTGQGFCNGIRTVVNYSHQVPNIPGDSSTLGSGRITIWFQRMIFQTDQFETNQVYPVNANAYVNEHGLFTTRKPKHNSPAVCMVTAPPSPMNPSIELLLY